MKTAFSSMVCPRWSLNQIIDQAAELGFDGFELRGLGGELHLPLVPALAGKPESVRELCNARGVEIVCLGCSAALDSKKRSDIARQRAIIIEFVELSARLGCPAVKIFAGDVQRWDNKNVALSRIARELIDLIPVLVRWNVRLLVENSGDFAGSDDLWFLIDAVSHPFVRCCWNQCVARCEPERPTVSIPRLGNHIGLVHMCDGVFDENGVLLECKPLGEGRAEVAREIELLKGIAYDGYLVFEWPKLWVDALPEPEQVLGSAFEFLRTQLDLKQPVLSAYKNDKNAPKLASRQAVVVGSAADRA